MVTVSVSLTTEEYAALRAEATSYGEDEPTRMRVWIGPSLQEAMRRLERARWERRRRTLDTNPDLAAQVDART